MTTQRLVFVETEKISNPDGSITYRTKHVHELDLEPEVPLAEAARSLRVHRNTLYRWCQEGKLKAGSDWRYRGRGLWCGCGQLLT